MAFRWRRLRSQVPDRVVGSVATGSSTVAESSRSALRVGWLLERAEARSATERSTRSAAEAQGSFDPFGFSGGVSVPGGEVGTGVETAPACSAVG